MDFKKFVNESYLDLRVLEEMKKSYFNNGKVLRLEGFLKEEVYRELVKLLGDIEGEHIKIANKYSYQSFNSLSGVEKLFLSKEFFDFANAISGENFERCELKIRKFGNKDYTLLHDSESEGNGIEFLYVFSGEWDESFGGQIVYTDNEENGRTLVFSIKENSFVLINSRCLRNFVKYVNHLAEKKSFILISGILR